MIWCAFDTETTGKADYRLPIDHPNQPRIVQLGAVLFRDDNWETLGEINCIVRPSGFSIPEEVVKIHGIDTGRAMQQGVPLLYALDMFSSFLEVADGLASHNLEFDKFIVGGEARRVCVRLIPLREYCCTMLAMTPRCQIPGRFKGFKWPNLQEAHFFAFGEKFDGAHGAMADTRAVFRLFRWLRENPPPIR